MSKKKIIILIIVLVVLGFALNSIFIQPEEFNIEEVMIDRGGGEY